MNVNEVIKMNIDSLIDENNVTEYENLSEDEVKRKMGIHLMLLKYVEAGII